MFYPSVAFESKCRLCGNVFDKKHTKNLFVKSNEHLCDAEIVNGGTLPCEEGLPSRDRHIMLKNCLLCYSQVLLTLPLCS